MRFAYRLQILPPAIRQGKLSKCRRRFVQAVHFGCVQHASRGVNGPHARAVRGLFTGDLGWRQHLQDGVTGGYSYNSRQLPRLKTLQRVAQLRAQHLGVHVSHETAIDRGGIHRLLARQRGKILAALQFLEDFLGFRMRLHHDQSNWDRLLRRISRPSF
jgi:hypothetical protein